MEGFVDHSFCILMVFAMSEKNINLAQGSHADDLTNGIDSLIDKRNKQLNRQKEQTLEQMKGINIGIDRCNDFCTFFKFKYKL